jgi:uncharacterized protein YjiS (DUF1127 family)
MANLINMIIAGIENRRAAAERNRAYKEAVRELQAYSDNDLMDLGIARSDIATVVKYGTADAALAVNQLACECEEAVHELETYSDHDLDDLGLARGDIVRAVKYGRKDELFAGGFPASNCAHAL